MAETRSRDGVIGLRVQAARKAAGLSQEDMGRRMGLTKGGYGQYERGMHPFTAEQLFELANILGRSVEYFLDLKSDLTPEEDQVLALYRRARELGLADLFVRMAQAIAGGE